MQKIKELIKVLTLIVLLTLTTVSYCQDSIPMLDKKEIGRNRVLGFHEYNESSLWGYIDGGADIFMEYGFKKLSVEEIIWKAYLLRIEIYRMTDKGAAFGIYSASHIKCSKEAIHTQYECLNLQQAQMVMGDLYINITTNRGNLDTKEICEDVAGMLQKKQSYIDYEIPKMFRADVFKPYLPDLKLIRGNLGLQNAYPEWGDKLDGFENYEVLLLPADFAGGNVCVARMEFKTISDLKRFIDKYKLIPGGKKTVTGKTTRQINVLNDKTAIFIESWGSSKDIDTYVREAEKIK